MLKKIWSVLLVIILLLTAVWLLLFASNKSLMEKQGIGRTTPSVPLEQTETSNTIVPVQNTEQSDISRTSST